MYKMRLCGIIIRDHQNMRANTTVILDIRWDFSNRQIIHAFFERDIVRVVDMWSVHIAPDKILRGVQHETQKESLTRVRLVRSSTSGRDTHPRSYAWHRCKAITGTSKLISGYIVASLELL